MCVELNQLRPVSSTAVGAGQPDGTVTVDVAEVVELGLVLLEAFGVVLGAVGVVLDVVLDTLATTLLVVFEEVAGALLDVVVLLELVVLAELVLAELVEEDDADKHPSS